MPYESPTCINIAVEGLSDQAVARRLVRHVGAETGDVFGLGGKTKLLQQLRGFNLAAQHAAWFVLVDPDQKIECAPALIRTELPEPAARMAFRVAVREIEAWLMGDRDRLAIYLSVSKDRLHQNPDALLDPKQELVNIARHSKKRDVREDMTPARDGGRDVGPGYTLRLIEFASDVETGWRPEEAARQSDSLRRCIERLRLLVAGEADQG